MPTFTYEDPATVTTRSGLQIYAYVTHKGAIITDSERGGWTQKTDAGIRDSHCTYLTEIASEIAAEAISTASGEIIGGDEVRTLWAMLA